jgi:hypothetical protein
MGVPPSAHVLEKGWTALHFAALQGNEVRSPMLPFLTILWQYHLSTESTSMYRPNRATHAPVHLQYLPSDLLFSCLVSMW